MKKVIILATLITAAGCSSTGIKKVVVDASPDKPSWVEKNVLSWSDGDKIYFRSQQTVRGDQRVNGCYQIASHDSRETLLRGIADQMKGATQEAQTDLNENAEQILGKVRSGEWEGKLYGFSDEERYFERYQIRDMATGQVTERIDCYTLSSVSKADYARTRQEVLNKVVAVDQRVRDAITKKQVQFFEDRSPSSTEGASGKQ